MSLDEKVSFLQEIRSGISKIPKSLSALVFAGAVALGNYSCDSSACEADNECKEGQICVKNECVYSQCSDKDGDGYGDYCDLGEDCDDNDDKVHEILSCNYDGRLCGDFQQCAKECPLPPAESCDGEDNDCDGETDEEVLLTFYRDNDEDGFGDFDSREYGCGAPPGYVDNSDDCDDNNREINPYVIERCDNLDNDCDGSTDEEDACGKIVFTSHRDGNDEIYVMGADGSGPRNLTNYFTDDWYPSWSPNGTEIAFTSRRSRNWEIYVMNTEGSNLRNLTNNSASEDWESAWSPEGTQIAFASYTGAYWDIYVMDADGSNQRNLTNDPYFDREPAWSPDGTRIAFTSRRDGNYEYEIYVMNPDGTNLRNLTNNSARDENPAWSPDGIQIAFVSQREGDLEIYVMKADGSEQRRLTNNLAEDNDPSWSPDGRHIAFTSKREGNAEIYVMKSDGTDQTRLTNNSDEDKWPDWAP